MTAKVSVLRVVATCALLVSCGLLAACDYSTDLGDNFRLYEHDSRDVYVGYCFNDCEKSSIPVIPTTVVRISYDSNWIIAEVKGSPQESGYWIVDKNIEADFCYDCGLTDSVRANVDGPLPPEDFEAILESKSISLTLPQ